GEADRQRLHLTTLRGHLTRVGEPAVEGQVPAGPVAELPELILDPVALLLELGAHHRRRRVRHPVIVTSPSPIPPGRIPPGPGDARRRTPPADAPPTPSYTPASSRHWRDPTAPAPPGC